MAIGTTVVTLTHTDELAIDTTKKSMTVRNVINFLSAATIGAKIATIDVKQNGGTGVAATGIVTAAVPAAADTVTVNGVVLTCAQLHARATAIFATIVADNVLTVNGVAFTAKASASGDNQFALGANDTAAVDNCVAKINAHPTLLGVITAVADTAGGDKTVKLRAVTLGTAGNAFTLTKTGAPITVSGATFAAGAAPSGNQWDFGDTNPQAAESLAACIVRSATAFVAGVVTATAVAAVCTVAASAKGLAGNFFTLASSNGTRLAVTGVTAGKLTGGLEAAAATLQF